MFQPNPILAADFYKVGHVFQYPKNTQVIYSNFTARSGKHFEQSTGIKTDGVVFWKLQGVLHEIKDMFDIHFFNRPKDQVLEEYKRRTDGALGTDSVTVEHIGQLHDLGYLPLLIKALPEGSVVPFEVPMFTIENTIDEFYWLTNYMETMLSAELWKGITIATIAREYRKLLEQYAVKTGSPMEFVDWQGHDFSMRGLSGIADSANAAGHLLFFTGTDTIPAIEYLEKHYYPHVFVGGSVPATEHSVMCAGGSSDERETIRRLITEVYPSGVVSVVSDTWDFWKTITVHAASLKDEILNRQPNAQGLAKVVFRPDSGYPPDIVCGLPYLTAEDENDAAEILCELISNETPHGECGESDPVRLFKIKDKYANVSITIEWNRYDKQYYYIDGFYGLKVDYVEPTPQQKGALECLWETFGGTYTATGHRVLNQRVGLIYGDSITLKLAKEILERMDAMGFASCNIVFGIGSYTYQYITRDTFGMAMKATWALIDEKEHILFKDPVTDNGVKKSARGRLVVTKSAFDNKYMLIDNLSWEEQSSLLYKDELKLVFLNGRMYNQMPLHKIRELAKESL